MTQFFAKKLNKKGFTLAELLIVVAIIAILVAVALPIFANALDQARVAVHESNARAIKAMAVTELLAPSTTENKAASTSWIELLADKDTTEIYAVGNVQSGKITFTGFVKEPTNKLDNDGEIGEVGVYSAGAEAEAKTKISESGKIDVHQPLTYVVKVEEAAISDYSKYTAPVAP